MIGYQIRFISGELRDQVVPVRGEPLSLGRSHTNHVRLKAPDISGKHLILSSDERGVELQNLSMRITLVDDRELAMGDRVVLAVGQCVQLGDDTRFILEATLLDDDGKDPGTGAGAAAPEDETPTVGEDGEATAVSVSVMPSEDGEELPTSAADHTLAAGRTAAPDDDDVTVGEEADAGLPLQRQERAAAAAPAPVAAISAPDNADAAGDDDENLTVSMRTRLASAEELEQMKDLEVRRKITRRLILWGVILLLSGGLVGGMLLLLHRETETFTSWPVDAAGQELSRIVALKDLPFQYDIDVKVPMVPGMVVKQEPGRLDVETRLGKYRDVPLHIMLEYRQDPGSLRKDRRSMFEDWISGKAREENWNFDFIQPLRFFQAYHGIPYLQVSFSRTYHKESYYGHVLFMRYMDWIFIMVKEVPTRERWRAEAFTGVVCFFRFSEKFLMQHWEGMADTYSGKVANNLDEAKILLQRNSPTVWSKVDFLLRSVLCETKNHTGLQEEFRQANDLLLQLRRNQIDWFNAQKIAYLLAARRGQKHTRAAVLEMVKSVFSSEEDQRFYTSRQGELE